VDALTHLNYAFAYIDPDSFQLTSMDVATRLSLFDDLANLKLTKPDLKIFISVGGWTFSDNNTLTQPVFGNIARSSSNREKFAKNVLAFLDEYGFDGVDLDWYVYLRSVVPCLSISCQHHLHREYPGAGDRGGKPEDTKNYVELLQAMRKEFDNSGRDLGITFTAPSSYWYLRWFDLPGMLKYADWMNLVSFYSSSNIPWNDQIS
jgi:chitinase